MHKIVFTMCKPAMESQADRGTGEAYKIKMYSELEGSLDFKASDAENSAYFCGV